MKILRHVCSFCDAEVEGPKGECEYCSSRQIKHTILPIQELPIGTVVKLTKRAKDKFYMTDECVDCYMRGKVENGDMDFEQFFEHYRFNAGLDAGIVVGFGASITHTRVKFFSQTGNWVTTYIGNYDLEIVEEAI